jgi:hypothetical protein
MEVANISGSITINLTPDHARQINWENQYVGRTCGQDL